MRKYDDEFKREAVRKIFLTGSRSHRLRANEASPRVYLHRWKRDALEMSTDAEREVLALRKGLREVEMERDIVRKAALIFGRSG